LWCVTRCRCCESAARGRVTLSPLRQGSGEHREQVTLRRQIREVLRLARHIERKGSPGADGGEPRQRSALEGLTAATMLASVVDRLRGELVRLALRRGATWNEIGRALGVSKQAAHARYRDVQPDDARKS
jgi:hypothetical protein